MQQRRNSNALFAERWVSNRKVSKSWFDSRFRSVPLYSWGQTVYSSRWPTLTKDVQTEQFCVLVVS